MMVTCEQSDSPPLNTNTEVLRVENLTNWSTTPNPEFVKASKEVLAMRLSEAVLHGETPTSHLAFLTQSPHRTPLIVLFFVKLQWASVFDLNVCCMKALNFVVVNMGSPFLNVLSLSLNGGDSNVQVSPAVEPLQGTALL
jgi:hypothetical protein